MHQVTKKAVASRPRLRKVSIDTLTGLGWYSFRARLRKTSNGRASEYSPTKFVIVN